jgi:hypothetical protein
MPCARQCVQAWVQHSTMGQNAGRLACAGKCRCSGVPLPRPQGCFRSTRIRRAAFPRSVTSCIGRGRVPVLCSGICCNHPPGVKPMMVMPVPDLPSCQRTIVPAVPRPHCLESAAGHGRPVSRLRSMGIPFRRNPPTRGMFPATGLVAARSGSMVRTVPADAQQEAVVPRFRSQ